MINRIVIAIAFVGVLAARAGAQPASAAAEHIAAGQREFEKGNYAAAVKEYDTAFALDSTAENALRIVVAGGYAVDLASVSKNTEIWLLKKREDAKRLGDGEASWRLVEGVGKALRYASSEEARQVQALQDQVADLQQQLAEERTTVKTIRAGYEKQLEDMRQAFKLQLDQATNQHGPQLGP